jgi:hypothetical protein
VRIKNWECYQLADTPLDTLLGTDLETLANADTARASSENIATMETPKGTASGTPLATHNKNYILLKNKLNNTDTNKKLRIAAICTNRMFLQKYFSVSLPTRIIATLSSTFTITVIAHEFFLLVLITITVCIIRQAKTAKLTAFTLYSVWQAVTSFHA